jgi:hypothetical protein
MADAVIPIHPNKDFDLRNYRIVVIDCLYDTISDSISKSLLGKLADFKISSYRKEYPYGILPIGAHDIAGTHFLLCEKNGEELEPIVGFKTISPERCLKFGLELPGLGIVSEPGLEKHRAAIEDAVDTAQKAGKQFTYIGSWAMRPDIRDQDEVKKLCYDISAVFVARMCLEYQIETAITFASLRFKVDRFHKWMGFQRLDFRGEYLKDFQAKSFFNEPTAISIIHAKNLSAEAKAVDEKYRKLWDEKLEIKAAQNQSLPKVA